MITIGLDQSTKRSAYSVYDDGKLIDYGTIFADETEKNPYTRMKQMHDGLQKMFARYRPEHVAIEQIQYQSNKHAYMILGNMQGVVFGILYSLDIPFTVVEASKWRSHVGIKPTNKRAILKQEAIKMVSEVYHVEASEDESESILIGAWLCDMIAAKKGN